MRRLGPRPWSVLSARTPERRGERGSNIQFLDETRALQSKRWPMGRHCRGSNVANLAMGRVCWAAYASSGMHAVVVGLCGGKRQHVWSLCTAIASHHVAWGRVLDSQSHSFWPCSVFCICCFSAESPVKAINKDRIGQADAVDLHLHNLTAVIVVCIDFAHCPPHLHLATQPAALPMSESAQESVAHFYLIRRVRRRP